MKSHFRQAHPGDWTRLHQATVKLCQTFTTHTIKGQACPFCSYKVHDRRNHPEQCPVLYQAVSQWTRSRTDLQRQSAGRSPPQQETQSLHRYFGKKSSAEAASQSLPEDQPISLSSGTSSSVPRQSCILSNTSNACYANSVMQSMLVLCWEGYDLGVFGSLMHILSSPARKPLNFFGQFEFRHLTAGWRLDGRQHDASEFFMHILTHPAGSLSPAHWQARTDGQVEDSDTGTTPLLLPVPAGASGLQLCFDQWSDNTFQRALSWAPEILPVVLCRWQSGSKSHVHVSWQDPIQVVVWAEGQNRSQVAYQAISGVAHRGDELSSGHYQAFWRLTTAQPAPPQVFITDDYRQPWLASASEQTALHQDAYLLLLQRQA